MEPWKIKRELRRLRQQLQAIPELFYEPLLCRWHDARREHRLQVTSGGAPAQNKVAIYLVYQPSGLSLSTLLTCDHLKAQGYAPMVVSNSPVDQASRTRLLPRVWRLLERPNFGYDFGGYRDGLWLLQRWAVRPRCLILMNDSIWFPARKNDQTIASMESMAADFCGVLKLGDDHAVTTRRRRPAFLGSFFLMFKEKALQSDAFVNFWEQYRCTSNKYKTIRRGERGISAAMIAAGMSWGSVFDKAAFQAQVRSMGKDALHQLLTEIVITNPDLDSSRRQLLQTEFIAMENLSAATRSRIIEIVLEATGRNNIFSSAPINLLRDHKLPFIKKATDVPNHLALKRLVRTLDERPSDLSMPSVVEQELRALVARHG